VQPPALALDLPEFVSGLDLVPQVLVEGQTGRLRVTTTAAVTISPTYVLFLPVPVFTSGGIYALNLAMTPVGGVEVSVNLNIQIVDGQYGTQYITLPADRVGLLDPGIEQNELTLLQSVTSTFNPERYFTGPMSLPAAAPMNSPFGTRRSYNGGPVDRYHNGADFAGAPGSPVLASAPGRVVLADTLNIRGNTIVIDHGWGVYTVYAHMSDRLAQPGDFVQTGSMVGTVGATGRATGAHLHWELWVNGVAVDPMQWVRQPFP
jgi:murein DD-endopeptidase MepM/ murein hydrolase activator NlpD